MGRKIVPQDVQEETEAMDLALIDQNNRETQTAEINTAYGDGQPYERLRLMNEIAQLTRCAQESILQAGRRLLILKANEEHGSWMATIEQMGLSQKYVERAMAVAKGFGKFDNLSNLSQSQFKAISFFSEEEKFLLNDGGEVLGITIDDISRMTKKEIEAAYREEIEKRKTDKEAAEKRLKSVESVIASKEKKLTELELEAANKEPPTKEQIAQAELDGLRKDFMGAIFGACYEVKWAIETLAKAQAIEGVTLTQLETFARRYEEDYAALCENAETLEEAINNICPNKKE